MYSLSVNLFSLSLALSRAFLFDEFRTHKAIESFPFP